MSEGRQSFFFTCSVELSGEAGWSWTFAYWEFLITASIALLVIGLFYFFLVQSW